MSMPMTVQPNARDSQRAADAWNDRHKPGDAVLVSFDGGAEYPGKLKSAAMVVAGRVVARVVFARIVMGGGAGTFEITRIRKA